MSSLPNPQPAPDQSNPRLVEQLQQQARLRQHLSRLDQRIVEAKRVGADELNYTWQSDDREAEVTVYFRRGEEIEVIASRLATIDGREPTLQERVRFEDDFNAEMHAGGDLWLAVASNVWDRTFR